MYKGPESKIDSTLRQRPKSSIAMVKVSQEDKIAQPNLNPYSVLGTNHCDRGVYIKSMFELKLFNIIFHTYDCMI